MKKSAQLFMWILIGVIIILIIYVIFISKKEPPAKVNLLTVVNDNTGENPIVIPPPTIANSQTFSIGDSIYAGNDLTNVYTSCMPSSTNIYNTYKTGDLIGIFLRRENACIAISVKTYPFGLEWIPIEGSEEVYLPLNALIYKQ